MMRPQDETDGNIVVLEVLVVGLLIVGSIAFVLSFKAPTEDSGVTRSKLDVMAGDILAVMAETTTESAAYQGNFLNAAVAEALHGDPDRLAFKVGKLLPPGTGFNLHLGNGVATRELHTVGPPPGQAVSAIHPLAPGWSYSVVVPDFLRYSSDGSTPMNVTMVPVRRSNVLDPGLATPEVNFTNGHTALLEAPGPAPGLVSNASIPRDDGSGSGYAVSGDLLVQANWTLGSTGFPGSHGYEVTESDVVESTHGDARAGLNASSLDATPGTASVGTTVDVAWNLTPVVDAVEADLVNGSDPEVTVTVLEPVQGLHEAPTRWSVLDRWRGQPPEGSAELTLPRSALYGAHVVVAELNYTLQAKVVIIPSGEINQTARLVTTFDVAPPGGSVPPDPLYQVSLSVWYEDWG